MTNKKNLKKIAASRGESAVRTPHRAAMRQPTGLSRDELRQIVIEMIG